MLRAGSVIGCVEDVNSPIFAQRPARPGELFPVVGTCPPVPQGHTFSMNMSRLDVAQVRDATVADDEVRDSLCRRVSLLSTKRNGPVASETTWKRRRRMELR